MSLSLRVCIRFHRTKYEIKARYVLCKMLKLRAKTDSYTQRYGRQPPLSDVLLLLISGKVFSLHTEYTYTHPLDEEYLFPYTKVITLYY